MTFRINRSLTGINALDKNLPFGLLDNFPAPLDPSNPYIPLRGISKLMSLTAH